jgi:hypothetical protein
MTGTPLVIGVIEVAALEALRGRALEHPVDVVGLADKLHDPDCKRAHTLQMGSQSVHFPSGFLVTFSIETGHPIGTCRHMSLSSPAKGRVPSPEALDAVAALLGFIGGHRACASWVEHLERGEGPQPTVNLVQPLTVMTEGHS